MDEECTFSFFINLIYYHDYIPQKRRKREREHVDQYYKQRIYFSGPALLRQKEERNLNNTSDQFNHCRLCHEMWTLEQFNNADKHLRENKSWEVIAFIYNLGQAQ
jgi:hypothetical protein